MPEHIFLKSEHCTYSYDQLNSFAAFFYSFLRNGSTVNGPIGILADSCDEFVFIIAACWKLNIPFICFNPKLKHSRLIKQIESLDPAVIFTDDQKWIKHSSYFIDIDELSAKQWIEQHSVNHFDVETSPSDVFGYFFTSGTTSAPKIVPLKRRQLLTAANASTQNIELDRNSFWLLCMPLYHVGGVSIILRSIIYESAVYRVDKFRSSIASLLSRDKQIKAVSLVPTMLKRLMEQANFKPHHDLTILLGGGRIYNSLLNRCLENNIHVISSYGMTETCAQIAASPVTKGTIAKGSSGSVFMPNNIQIRNDKNESLSPNNVGTIWLKGPQVFDGYYRCKHQTIFDKNGWFNTGDFGQLDDNEQLIIKSRRTDLIVTGGENVSPFEVEEALLELDGIKEAAVIGLPHKEWGQMVAAVVVSNSSKKWSVDNIKHVLKAKLANYKIPKKIVSIDKLPRTDTGKIKRDKLDQLF